LTLLSLAVAALCFALKGTEPIRIYLAAMALAAVALTN
jgi:hypothetical protein